MCGVLTTHTFDENVRDPSPRLLDQEGDVTVSDTGEALRVTFVTADSLEPRP